jgi:hypothetical protein
MQKSDFRSGERWQRHEPLRQSEGQIEYLLKAEAKILQSISARAPLPKVLNEICTALDCQIGNMVSLISLSADDVTSALDIAQNAALFGLHIFFSSRIVAQSGEAVGSLEMYSCVSRSPSDQECELIERAVCLAVIAIECDVKDARNKNSVVVEDWPVQGNVLKWPISLN